jgi:hypothetical protein
MRKMADSLPQSIGDWYKHFPGHVATDSPGDLELFKENLTTKVWENFSGIPLAAWKEFATGPHCPESIRDLYLGFGKVKQSLSPVIQKHLASSSDCLLALLMTVDCQDEQSLRNRFHPLLNGIRQAFGHEAPTGSDDRDEDSKMLSILEQRADYRIGVLEIRLRRLRLEKTQECWNRLDDVFWILPSTKVDALAEELVDSYRRTSESSSRQEIKSQSAHGKAVLRMASNLSDRVHEAIVAAPESRENYMHLANVSNGITSIINSR